MKKTIIAFFAAGFWISLSEFLRNELLFKSYWLEKYQSLGLMFPSSPINNALWGVWSFILGGVILFLSRRLRFLETIGVAWVMGFVLMWIVIGNMNVLPNGILWIAVPWSVAEVWVAVVVCKRVGGIRSPS